MDFYIPDFIVKTDLNWLHSLKISLHNSFSDSLAAHSLLHRHPYSQGRRSEGRAQGGNVDIRASLINISFPKTFSRTLIHQNKGKKIFES